MPWLLLVHYKCLLIIQTYIALFLPMKSQSVANGWCNLSKMAANNWQFVIQSIRLRGRRKNREKSGKKEIAASGRIADLFICPYFFKAQADMQPSKNTLKRIFFCCHVTHQRCCQVTLKKQKCLFQNAILLGVLFWSGWFFIIFLLAVNNYASYQLHHVEEWSHWDSRFDHMKKVNESTTKTWRLLISSYPFLRF